MTPRPLSSVTRQSLLWLTGGLLVCATPPARADTLASLDDALLRARKHAPVSVEADGQLAVARTSELWARPSATPSSS